MLDLRCGYIVGAWSLSTRGMRWLSVSVDPASFPSWRFVWGLCPLYLSNSMISSLDTNLSG